MATTGRCWPRLERVENGRASELILSAPHDLFGKPLFEFGQRADDMLAICATNNRIVIPALDNLEAIIPAFGAVQLDTHTPPTSARRKPMASGLHMQLPMSPKDGSAAIAVGEHTHVGMTAMGRLWPVGVESGHWPRSVINAKLTCGIPRASQSPRRLGSANTPPSQPR